MKVTKEVEVPAKIETQIDHIKCELCTNTTDEPRNWGDRNGSARSSYDVNETTVELRTGYSVPDGGDIKSQVIDICPKCFVEKLIPWIKSQGGDVRTEKSEW